ncbi:MAG: hypothetical protein ACFE89_09695 [Candidatus Hodarchaeota archaeon]
MDWKSLGKRLAIVLPVCFVIAWLATFLLFQFWTISNFFMVVLFMGIILLVFGACLRTPFVEAMATTRYSVNPQVTRDTVRGYSDRRREQSQSGVVILVTGALLLVIGLLGVFLFP